MKLLLDTNLLLWAAQGSPRLSARARALIEDAANGPMFSAISIVEVAIKSGLGRPDFAVDAAALRMALLDNGYDELALTGEHAAAIGRLPAIHKDPFDRLLIAQASVEGIALLTGDETVASYAGPVRLV